MSLAAVYRELYRPSRLSDIRADALLSTVAQQIVQAANTQGHQIIVHFEFDDLCVVPDQAVPLALLVSEAVTNALDYAAIGDRGAVELWLSLKRSHDSTAKPSVRNTAARAGSGTGSDTPEGIGLGSQLIAAFAMQIGGTVTRERSEGFYCLTVGFKVEPVAGKSQHHEAPAL